MEVLSNIPPLHGDKCPLAMMTPANVGHLECVKKVWIITPNVQEKVKVMDMLSEQYE